LPLRTVAPPDSDPSSFALLPASSHRLPSTLGRNLRRRAPTQGRRFQAPPQRLDLLRTAGGTSLSPWAGPPPPPPSTVTNCGGLELSSPPNSLIPLPPFVVDIYTGFNGDGDPLDPWMGAGMGRNFRSWTRTWSGMRTGIQCPQELLFPLPHFKRSWRSTRDTI
jgi:hypothetical protein